MFYDCKIKFHFTTLYLINLFTEIGINENKNKKKREEKIKTTLINVGANRAKENRIDNKKKPSR